MELFRFSKPKPRENSYSGLITMLKHYRRCNGEDIEGQSTNLYTTLALSQHKALNLDNPFEKSGSKGSSGDTSCSAHKAGKGRQSNKGKKF